MRLRAITVVLGILLAAAGQAYAQQTANEIVIEAKEVAATPSAPAARYLNGYASSVNGQTIEYHSSDPDADSALLVRGQSIAHSISWETDPIPEASGEFSHFIWLAGIECAGFEGEKDSHRFDFLINGQLWFTFKNAKDATARNWRIAGKDGAELSFAAAVTDHVGDLFGYMVLTVPRKDFAPGKGLTLEVRGDNSGSADWYMTFQHRFNFVPQVRAEPALVRDGGQIWQQLRLSLDNLAEGRTLEVHAPNHEAVSTDLKIGANVLRLSIPAVTAEVTMPVTFKLNGKVVETSAVHITPVKKRDIYLLSYSHNDIGYTDLQPEVERKQWNNLEQAMRLIRETRDYPADARYKWNLETIWSLESYLKQASPAQREELLAHVREGSIGLSALYANMLTGLANSVEMSHFFDFARRLRAEYHIPMTTAVTSDVPGFSWGIVSALAQSGVKYFATAPNSGDRIGYTLQAWGDKPFYWASQSGQERVLTWMAGASYSSFHEGPLSKLGDEKIMKLVRRLDDASYPYEIVQLPYTLGDNGPPDPTLADFVRKWNERYVTPRLILATHEEMFREFEKRYGSTLPVVQGDFTPYWEDGAASTAFETALNRAAVDRLLQGEALWSMLSPASYPEDEYDSAWRNVVFYDEHTWGAHNSTEEPDLPFVKEQWEFKRKFALDADRASRALLTKALHSSAEPARIKTSIDVYNTNSWPRTDVVFLSPEMSAAGDRVVDLGGQPVPSQRLSTGELAVLVENVPPFSAQRLLVEKGTSYSRSKAKALGNALENDFIEASIDPQTGAIDNLKWKTNGVQLVDKTRGAGLNQYLYVLGTDPEKAQPLSNVRVRVKEPGPLVASLLVEADAPGAKRYSTEIRLIEGINRVDMITNIDKRAVREKEGVHIAFPFAVPGGQLRYDVANGVVRPEADQLAGACKNFFSVQSWVDVSNRDYGVTWATANAPLIEIGAITAEQPWMKSIQPSSMIYSYVMNNYWHTNYKADQEGPVTFRYSVLPHAGFTAVDAVKFGVERRRPLIVASTDSSSPPPPPLMRLSAPDVVVSSVKPIAGGHSWLVYLYNPSGKAQQIRLHWNGGVPVSIRSSSAAGEAGDPIHDIEVAAFGSVYLSISTPDSPRADRR
ncbi:MAG: glycoside hydrolase family 38 C-terminal domain-containing protein [Candidatus Sulfotelmatobacter sp.]